MSPERLPERAKELYMAAEKAAKDGICKDREDKESCIAKVAWGAVKRRFRKTSDGKWIPKSDLREFSLAIVKASYDKATNEMRWRAVASDTDDDRYNDNMTMELFNSFLNRIENSDVPPDEYISESWRGGMPYLSVAHYSDLNGTGIPGEIETVYVDGNRLKAKGIFYNSDLGRACFKAICEDLYSEKSNIDNDKKVRISIAFLDYKHKHKDSDSIFERSDIEDICLECVLGSLTGKNEGKEFLDGHLVHLALTRVPVNPRTPVELEERSMAEIKTRRDDARSIIGDELTELLEKAQANVGKSQVMVVKSDEPTIDDLQEDKKVRDDESKLEILSQVWEKLTNEYDEDDREQLLEQLRAVYHSAGMKTPSEVEMENEILKKLGALQDQVTQLSETITDRLNEPEIDEHVLDHVLDELKVVFDEQLKSNVSTEEKLIRLQSPFNKLGDFIRSRFGGIENTGSNESTDVAGDISKSIAEALAPLQEQVRILAQQLSQQKVDDVPVRRSLTSQYGAISSPVKLGSIKDIARKSVGLG